MDQNALPSGWKLKSIDKLGQIYSGSTPSTNDKTYWGGEINWITPNDLSNLETRYIHSSERRITKAGLKNSTTHLLPANSLVISSRAPIGYLALPTKEFCTNQGCKSIVFNEEHDPEFHYYNILFRVKLLKDKGHGTTFAEISKKALAQIEMPVPDDKKVQSKIAEVLSTIDYAIAQVKVLIAKHQRIKTGLMQALLTRGIDEHGQLRDRVSGPDLFEISDFGLFPKAWEVTTLGKIITKTKGIIQTGPFGTQLHASDYVEDGIPTMMPQGIDETGWIDDEGLMRLSLSKAIELRRHVLKENDVIFARRGELSKCSAISKREEGWICGTDFMLVRVPASVMSGEWFAHYYRNDICQRQVMAQAVGSIMKGINTPLLSSLVVALPDIDEQKRILAVIKTKEKIIKEKISQRDKLLKAKQGLMQDLLSGRVSVKPLMEE